MVFNNDDYKNKEKDILDRIAKRKDYFINTLIAMTQKLIEDLNIDTQYLQDIRKIIQDNNIKSSEGKKEKQG